MKIENGNCIVESSILKVVIVSDLSAVALRRRKRSNLKHKKLFAGRLRDCHGLSGLAMTPRAGFLQSYWKSQIERCRLKKEI
ncbi:MAG: hypothetical protein NTX52_12275 [Planctomycetota bacterium]|nr:hypothetical protein [Planctomycetota bacterium]